MPVSPDKQQYILSEYTIAQKNHQDFARTLAGLIENLLGIAGIQVHSVSYRTKTLDSLSEKLSRPEKTYSRLTDITDLSGVRITTYFSEDVDLAAAVLRAELEIDEQASVDKRVFTDPTRFGYRSLHYVASLTEARSSLVEYSTFATLKCEIQVRSVLQHAWAEIEHDLGYKSAAGVPASLRRRFSRIASLLELADDEFCAIRTALSEYEKSIPEKLRTTPDTVALDLPSFRALFTSPSNLTALDEAVVCSGNGQLNTSNLRRPDELVARLYFFGIQGVQQLESAAITELPNVSKFVRHWIGDKPIGTVDAGIGVFYLLYVLAWRTQDRTKISNYLDSAAIGLPEERENCIQRILEFNPR